MKKDGDKREDKNCKDKENVFFSPFEDLKKQLYCHARSLDEVEKFKKELVDFLSRFFKRRKYLI